MTDLPDRVLAILEREPMTMLELCAAVGAARTTVQRAIDELEMRGRAFHEKLPGQGVFLYIAKPRPRYVPPAKYALTREQLKAEREAWRKRCPLEVESGKCPRVRGEPISGSWAGPFRLHGIFTEAA